MSNRLEDENNDDFIIMAIDSTGIKITANRGH